MGGGTRVCVVLFTPEDDQMTLTTKIITDATRVDTFSIEILPGANY